MYIARISIPRTKQFRVVTGDDTFVFDELSGDGGNLLSEQKLFLRVPPYGCVVDLVMRVVHGSI